MTAASDPYPSVIPGSTIASRFRLERHLGRGSMGSVWLAQHLSLNVPVAVKFIDAAFRDKDEHRSRFAVEARTAAKINSPHVVNILDFGSDEQNRLYIAMEYLEGEDLEHLLARRGPLTPAAVARVIAHACHGLSKAHALGVVHRDIKPENLFLCGDQAGDDFVLKILDFGVAKAGQDIRQQFHGTRVGQLIGSPAYMSPEQARGTKTMDHRSDLFSLGVVAYHCLTGRLPFPGEGLGELLMAIIDRTPARVTDLEPKLPKSLDAWFAKALAKDPNARHQSAREMSDAFASAIGKSVTVSSNQDAYASGLNAVAPSDGRTSSFSASNSTPLRDVSGALAQVAEVSGVIGVALLDAAGQCTAHHSAVGMQPNAFSEMLAAIRHAVDSFDAVDISQPSAIGLHFENSIVLIRWIEDCPLIVIGVETVHPTVLSVSLSGAASKLATLARQHGGAGAFRRTSSSARPPDSASGIVTTVSLDDVVPDEAMARVAAIMASELGPLARIGIQRLVKRDGAPTFRTFREFVDRIAALGGSDQAQRTRLVESAMRLIPALPPAEPAPMAAPAPSAQAPAVNRSAAIPAGAPQRTAVWTPMEGQRVSQVASEPSIEVGAPVELAEVDLVDSMAQPKKPAKKKRTYVYRGKVYTVDD